MCQQPFATNMIDMFPINFQAVDGLGAGAGDDGGDAGGVAVGGEDFFIGLEGRGGDEVFSGLRPEGVLGRAADRVGGACDVDVDDLGGQVAEGARDDGVGAGFEGWAGLDGEDLGVARDVHFGQVEPDSCPRFGLGAFDPFEGPEQLVGRIKERSDAAPVIC